MLTTVTNVYRGLPFIEALPCPYLLQDSLRNLFNTPPFLPWSREKGIKDRETKRDREEARVRKNERCRGRVREAEKEREREREGKRKKE